MTILFDPARRVNPVRPFGAGILPPDARPAPRRRWEPSPADRAWWTAKCARLESRRNRPPAWVYDRLDRLSALVARARSAESHLLRERCDADRRTAFLAALDARLAVLARRIRRLCDAARAARRAARERQLDAAAFEAYATDALTAGLIPRDPGRLTEEDVARVTAVG